MALSQRLEFRQTQALVMTPQLMQAIKLLQLSSLDLAAYVEGELERNPLLERGSEDDETPPATRRRRRRLRRRQRRGRGLADWIGEELETSRSSMEEGLGTELENVFPDDGGDKQRADRSAAAGLFRMDRARAPAARRRLQSGSFRVGRDHARRSSGRADWRWRSPIRPHRMIGQLSDRYGGRGRLPHRRSRDRRREARRAARRGRGGARRAADARSAGRLRAQSHRMPGAPAQGAQPLRSGHAGAGRASRSAGQARSRRPAPHLRRRRRGSRRHDRRDPQPQSQAGPRLRLDRWCSRSCPMCSCAPRPTAPGRWN